MNKKELARRFALKHIPFKSKWLDACVECLKKNVGPEIQCSDKMLDHVFLQFLYSNLSDSLDPQMKIPEHAAKVVIIKRMVFQLISYTNISVSLYEQLSENTRDNGDLSWFHGETQTHEEGNRDLERDHTFDKNNNARPQNKKRGMLKLELTDGLNTVKAVELEEIFDHTFLVPGVKIIMTGHVKCRRGVLLLDKSNCDLLGGRIPSMEIDQISKLSMQLNVDLDAERKSRQETLAQSASVVASWNHRKTKKRDQIKADSSLNQSTMSPFLIKTNRKTGEVTNPPLRSTSVLSTTSRLANPVSTENWDFSIEELPATSPSLEPPSKPYVNTLKKQYPVNSSRQDQRTKEALQQPVKNLSSLVIEDPLQNEVNNPEYSINQEISTVGRKIDNGIIEASKKFPTETQKTDGQSVPKPFNDHKHLKVPVPSSTKTKQLPGQLLRASSNSIQEQLTLCRPTLGSPSMPADKRKNISEWIWDDSKCEAEQEDFSLPPSKQGKYDSVVEIPRCFLKDTVKRRVEDSEIDRKPIFLRTLHGPRKEIDNFGRKEKVPETAKITEHFATLKGPISRAKPTGSPRPVQSYDSGIVPPIHKPLRNEEITESYPRANESVEDMEDVISITPVPRKIVYHQVEDEEEEECSEYMDQEGEHDDSIMECTIEKEGRLELERWGLRGRKPATRFEEEKVAEHSPGFPFHTRPTKNQSQEPSCSNNYRHTFASKEDKQIKTEIDERKKIARITNDRYPEEIKNKQSANVQIYKTPFTKRLASSDSSSAAATQLFQRMADLQIVPLADALVNRKFWLMSKIIAVMPTICHQVHELRSDGVDWLFQISVTDTSAASIKCRVATDLLSRLFGFTVQQCKSLYNTNQTEELRAKKSDAERKLFGFNRLDLLIWIEVSPEHEKLPLVVDVKTISDALNIL